MTLNLESLNGYEIEFVKHSDCILKHDFNDANEELATILNALFIKETQIVESGGGEASMTKDLGDMLHKKGWLNANVEVKQIIDGEELISESHEIDHLKTFAKGGIGLEIEWNNKDPFFDRDLENFRKLHSVGKISLGIIITRGKTLQKELEHVYTRFISSLEPFEINNLRETLRPFEVYPTTKQIEAIEKAVERRPSMKVPIIARKFYNSKYGTATTHFMKLMVRIERGVGTPCPLILIGIGKERLVKTNWGKISNPSSLSENPSTK